MSTWCSSNTTINFNVIYNKFNEWMCSVCIGSNRDLHTHIYGTHCLLYPLFYSNSLWENIITKTSDIWMLETFTQDLNESLLTFPWLHFTWRYFLWLFLTPKYSSLETLSHTQQTNVQNMHCENYNSGFDFVCLDLVVLYRWVLSNVNETERLHSLSEDP